MVDKRTVNQDVNDCIGGREHVVETTSESLGGFTVKLTVDTLTSDELDALIDAGYEVSVQMEERKLKLKPTAEKRERS